MVVGKYVLATCCMMYIGLANGLSQKNSNNNNKIKVEMGTGTVYYVSENKALKALAKLSKKAWKEDSWVYYDGKLIDNGKNEADTAVTIHFPMIVKTVTGDTLKVIIPDGVTFSMYHNHIYIPHACRLPPSIEDITNQSLLLDSVFTNNSINQRLAANGKIWEFSLEESLRHELRDKNGVERYELLKSKIKIAYTSENKFKFGDYYPYPYHFNPKDKKCKEYTSIMKEIGVNVKFGRPRKFYNK
jgi:hypothetical protein